MPKLVLSHPYSQLYLIYIEHISSILRILGRRPPLPESINLVQEHQAWWRRLCAVYGGPDEGLQETLYNYKRLAYNRLCLSCFQDDSLRDLFFIVHNCSTLSDNALYKLAELEDDRWRAYCVDYASCLSKKELKYRYLVAQKILAQLQPIRPQVEGDYFEQHIWRDIAEHCLPRSPVPRPARKRTKTSADSSRSEVAIPATKYDYEQIVSALIEEGWLTPERTKCRHIVNLMECVSFVECLYRANHSQVFPEELILRLKKDYQLVSTYRLNEFLGLGPAQWVSNTKEWLKQ